MFKKKVETDNQNLRLGYNVKIVHCFFTRLNLKKNGPSLILPFSVARKLLAPEARRIFEILSGILEGRTNSARHFLIRAWYLKIF